MYARFWKRLLDFLLALTALLVLSPLLLLLTVAGAVAMRGNPFFAQPRPGRGERIFRLIKFRTMSDRRDASGALLPDGERLNGYGRFLRKTSLDELPELFNILVGQMALVGPRPLLTAYLPLYSEEQHHRHDVRPGLTGYMLQKDLLLPWRTIADNIVLPKTLHGTRRQTALKSAVSDIAACGLRDLLNRRPDECSGGQRQRAALVRTLQTGKPLLLLDEPFGALDAITRLHLQALLTEIATKKRLTILFVTHDVDEALLLSDAILVMGTAPGRILRQYTLEEPRPRTMRVLSQPEFIRVKGEILTLLDKEVTADA